MSSEDSGHVFIFHGDDDDDPRPSTTRSEVVVAGEQYERINHPDSMRETFSAAETKFIRMRSACLNRSIDREPNLPAHVWPDRVRGISTSRLRYVVRSLSRSAPIPEGTNQLQALSDICSVIWFLECDRSPFLGAAESILQNWKTERREALDAEVKWLTVVAFVLRRDDDLKAHLENLVWHSSAKLEFPIDYLQKWVNEKRKQYLELIYTFFQEQISQLRMSHKNTGPVARIYSNLTSRGVDFRYGWSTHRDKGGIVVGMSPQELTDVVLDIIRKEMRDDGVQTGEDGKSDSTLNEVPRQAKSRHSGLRGGRGGDFFELFKSLITPPREEDGEIRAIRGVVVEAEAKKRNKWKELEQDEIDELIKWRDAQQNKWASGFLASNRMNGSAARPRYAQ